jgi:nucleoside-diphosphate-sugar epimerase
MNIFVTGATGVLGRSTVIELAERGHHVRGVARSDAKAAWLREHGVEPVTVDLFDAAAVKDAVAESDTVLHLATAIPEMKHMRTPGAWTDNDRLRTDTTRYLVDAALDHGVRTFVAESITFCYPDRGAEWIDERDPFGAEDAMRSVIDLEREVSRVSADGNDARGIVLRFGAFYGPDARSTDKMLGVARRGLAPFLGAPDAYLSSIHTEDASHAVVAALDVPAGTYNVCDEPVARRDAAAAFAAAFGLKRSRFFPGFAQRLVIRKSGSALLRSQRVSNAKFRAASGWSPRFATVREGWNAVAAQRAVMQ